MIFAYQVKFFDINLDDESQTKLYEECGLMSAGSITEATKTAENYYGDDIIKLSIEPWDNIVPISAELFEKLSEEN